MYKGALVYCCSQRNLQRSTLLLPIQIFFPELFLAKVFFYKVSSLLKNAFLFLLFFLGILEHSQNQKMIAVPHACMKLRRERGHTVFWKFY